jgi:hypothetical protein
LGPSRRLSFAAKGVTDKKATYGGSVASLESKPLNLPPETSRARHAQRSAKLSFASDSIIEPEGFVATKKMMLLSGNPDGFALKL